MDFSSREILIAVLGSGGLLGGLLGGAALIIGRLDKRKERKDGEDAKAIAQSAEIRRVGIETDKAALDGWKDLATERNIEIARIRRECEEEKRQLREEIEELENSTNLSRSRVREIRQALADLESEARSLRVSKCPDEVVDVLNLKIGAFEKGLKKLVTYFRNHIPVCGQCGRPINANDERCSRCR